MVNEDIQKLVDSKKSASLRLDPNDTMYVTSTDNSDADAIPVDPNGIDVVANDRVRIHFSSIDHFPLTSFYGIC